MFGAALPGQLASIVNVVSTNVQTFGARGDGVSNDTSAVVSAINALAAKGGGVLYFPAGTYLVNKDSLFINSSNTVWLGDGPTLSIIKGRTSGGQLVQASTATNFNSFVNLGFDTSIGNISAFALYGTNTRNIVWQNCRFIGFENGRAISLDEVTKASVRDCEFFCQGGGDGTGIWASGGGTHLQVYGSTFLYCTQGILVEGTQTSVDAGLAEYISVDDCYFDAGWWFRKAVFSGSGANVSYAVNTLTDSDADFSGISVGDVFRAMTVRNTGTTTAQSLGISLVDSTADFISSGVLRGEIVRVGGTFGIIAGIASATELRIEQWLDTSTYLPASAPANGATYTVYGLSLGYIASNTSTTVSVTGWYDLAGNIVETPADETLYEITTKTGYAGFSTTLGARRARIVNSTFLRSWSDQISLFGDDCLVANNVISDGQDVGITVDGNSGGGRTIVVGNKIHHQGSSGIWLQGANHIAANNSITSTQWANQSSGVDNFLAGITIAADNCRVISNVIDGQNQTLAQFGICVGSSSGSTIALNTCVNDQNGGCIKFLDNTSSATKLRDNNAVIVFGTGAIGQDFGVLEGAGSPESSITAGIGTLYRDTTNGTIYNKKSGTGNTGWGLAVPNDIIVGGNVVLHTSSGEQITFEDVFGNTAISSQRAAVIDSATDGAGINPAYSGFLFHNGSATGNVTLNLPDTSNTAAMLGQTYTFVAANAGAFQFGVQAYAGDVIRLNDSTVSSSGGTLKFGSGKNGCSFTLVCTKVHEWQVTAIVGTAPTAA